MTEKARSCCRSTSTENFDCQTPSASVVLSQAPILSTPENYGFNEQSHRLGRPSSTYDWSRKSEEQIWQTYEIERTTREILIGRWKRVALQFPDGMLRDAGAVVDGLLRALKTKGYDGDNSCQQLGVSESKICLIDENTTGVTPTMNPGELKGKENCVDSHLPVVPMNNLKLSDTVGFGIDATTSSQSVSLCNTPERSLKEEKIRLYILADTAYGSCCVDEIAAEHVDAEVIVHYGRSCLSPTTRLPVIYVFTMPPLDHDAVIRSFEETFHVDDKVILLADITYHSHVARISKMLEERGYANLIAPQVVHNPASKIPNRSIASDLELTEYSLFHISEPPPALLLTLSSRVKDMFIFPTKIEASTPSRNVIKATTSNLIRRRYALLNSLNTCPIFGILINTLSVANHLEALQAIQKMISRAGKKYYTFVVGKINAAKMANFSEVAGWVVVGCWESSLLESEDFYRPVITPWELDWVLQSDSVRVWKGEWRGDFGGIGESHTIEESRDSDITTHDEDTESVSEAKAKIPHLRSSDCSSESESEPPEFDVRTGRYVSHSRPMQKTAKSSQLSSHPTKASTALSRKARGDLTTVNGTYSPGAAFLRDQRTWTGLGSEFPDDDMEAGHVEPGRSGIARGYVGERR